MIKRKNFAKLKHVFDIPNLLAIQVDSYDKFLQQNAPKTKRAQEGLEGVFRETFPIESFDGKYRLDFVHYALGKPKYGVLECQRRGMSYASSLRARLRLRSKRETKEQDVYLGELPLMTNTGTFIINGDERVVVSQLHRSPGVCFEETAVTSGRRFITARIIPYRGAWVEFEFDASDVLHAFIDRRRKILATTLLRAMGCVKDIDILKALCGVERSEVTRSPQYENLINRVTAQDITAEGAQEPLIERFTKLEKSHIKKLEEKKIRSFKLLENPIPEILNTLAKDHIETKEDALIDIFRRIRPGDPPTVESAQALVDRMFFDPKRYNLGKVGRYILNRKLGMHANESVKVLTLDTVVNTIKQLINVKSGQGEVDDIDHLGNRRVRTVAELLENQFRIGAARLERSIRERMTIYDLENAMPHNLVNSKLVSSVIKDFFGRSQLSQFMDQTNPLAEMTHKRRLSALGPGGLSRERAGFEVRDVHHSHYGRICPIETPEGPNIGLISSLSTYAKVNDYGFIETPYRKVERGNASKKIEYLSADKEDKHVLAQANARLDASGRLADDLISCRHKGNFPKVARGEVDYMDVSPEQLVSAAASLIPFLEHDDANRALMGSNMQRQAVPLLFTEAPFIGTGVEERIARDSGTVVIAKADGVVREVSADSMTVGSVKYDLRKFARSNADTCINQRPIVKLGQKIKAGDVIADGTATRQGELALGRNVLVAFMPWRGYNFEDAVLISEKLLKEDVFTSVHVEEFEIEARETRLGNEEVTRDIPNVGEDALKDLDDTGIVRIGAEVEPGDILVGKITPKSETELSPEEKLLRAIFGEKAGDVRDASLTVPPGVEGIVVDVKIFTRKSAKSRSKQDIKDELDRIDEIKKMYAAQIAQVKREKERKLSKLLPGAKLEEPISDKSGRTLVAAGRTIKKTDIPKMMKVVLRRIKIKNNPALTEQVRKVVAIFDEQIEDLAYEQDREIDKIKRGDELAPGVLKKIVVHIATKRKIAVGDKIAGRHGNKGVIAKILPEESMPYLPDGTPVEIVLNPLGVPSRMNVGQILETHLGWAAKEGDFYACSPVFDGASETEIKQELKKCGLPEEGKIALHDGFTGEPFDQKVTVGYIYIMKLAHLVDDKIHARSIGPYSLVTQQPLGGKAQFGGQRFGEMEVWALEAYGAAYTLQELLTVKSDDVTGRTRIYEAIVKGENALQPGTPESFNVLVKELQALGLNVTTEKKL